MTPLDQSIVDALAAWALDTWNTIPELTIVASDCSRHGFQRPGRSGVPMTLPVYYVFGKWERAVQFAWRDRALAEQPAYTTTTERVDEDPTPYIPTSQWS